MSAIDDRKRDERGHIKRPVSRFAPRADGMSVQPIRAGITPDYAHALRKGHVVPALLLACAAGGIVWALPLAPHNALGFAALIATTIALDVLAADPNRTGRRVVGPSLIVLVAAFVLYGAPAAILIGAIRGVARAITPIPVTRVESSCVASMAVIGPMLAGAAAAAVTLAAPHAAQWSVIAAFVCCAFTIEVGAESLVLGHLSRPSILRALERNVGWSAIGYAVFGSVGAWLGTALAAGRWIDLLFVVIPLAIVRQTAEAAGGEERYVGTIEHENSVLFDRIGQLDRMNGDLIEALSMAIDARDPLQSGHSGRVAQLSTTIGAALGLAGERLEILRRAALLHDVGTLALSGHVTDKPGPLSPQERRYVQMHSDLGARFVAKWRDCRDMAQIIEQHHERLDGSGYPRGLAADAIVLEARIVAVAESYVGLTSQRQHRPALSHADAIDEIRGGAGTLFDARVIDALAQVAETRTADVLPITRVRKP